MWKPEHRLAADRRGLRYPSDLTDAEWAIVAAMIPPGRHGGRRRSVNVREVPGYRLELTPFGGIKDSGLGYKEGVQEAIKSFTNIKTYSLPWV